MQRKENKGSRSVKNMWLKKYIVSRNESEIRRVKYQQKRREK